MKKKYLLVFLLILGCIFYSGIVQPKDGKLKINNQIKLVSNTENIEKNISFEANEELIAHLSITNNTYNNLEFDISFDSTVINPIEINSKIETVEFNKINENTIHIKFNENSTNDNFIDIKFKNLLNENIMKSITFSNIKIENEEENNIEFDIQTEKINIPEIDTNTNTVEETTITNINETKAPETQNIENTEENTSIGYQTHVQNIGWQGYVENGVAAGTTGKGLRLEGIQIILNNPEYTGNILYRTHIQNIGWETNWKQNNEISGTFGKALRLEAIQIKLDGIMAEYYDIYYRVHVQNFGWLGWAKNSEYAGTAGYGYRLEAIQILIVKKGEEGPTNETKAFYGNEVSYHSHIQNVGWQKYVSDGKTSGTTNQSKRLEAIQIKLDGIMAEYYDIYYRVHAQNFGWLGWAKNSEYAGTAGYGYRLEAIQILIVKKGEEGPTNETKAFYGNEVSYHSHIQNVGWQKYVSDGKTSGTTNQSKRLEAIQIKLDNVPYTGNILYKTHIQSIGWESDWKQNNSISGTINKALRIEAIQIKLDGQINEYYDIYYRAYAQNFGWLGWAKNGETAGTIGYGYRLEAIQILLIKKNHPFDTTEKPSYYDNEINYSVHIGNVGWQPAVHENEIAGTVGKGKSIEAFKIVLVNQKYSGNILYKTYIKNYGWETNWKQNYSVSGTTGRGKNIEAIQIKLDGQMAEHYDIYYRVHVQSFGWLSWAKNGEYAGTVGYNYRLEAIQVLLVLKTDEAPQVNPSQESFITATEAEYLIVSKLDDNKVIESPGAQKKDGTNLSIYNRNNSLAQIWNFKKLNNGYYIITSAMNPNIAIQAEGGSAKIYKCNGSDSQIWILKDWGDGYFSIVSALNINNPLYFTLYNSSTANQTKIILSENASTDAQKFKLVTFTGTKIYNGIDISAHNVIDWDKLATAGVDFVIIRLGYGNNDINQDDSQFHTNVAKCEEYNIPYGLYIYSYALNTSDASSEADHTLRLLAGVGSNFQLGVWFDMEDADGYKARHGMPSHSTLVDICYTYATKMEANGYKAGIYASLTWLNDQLNSSKLDSFAKWVAQWPNWTHPTYSTARSSSSTYTKPYKIWQFCSDGLLYGITGNVDLNLGYNLF